MNEWLWDFILDFIMRVCHCSVCTIQARNGNKHHINAQKLAQEVKTGREIHNIAIRHLDHPVDKASSTALKSYVVLIANPIRL